MRSGSPSRRAMIGALAAMPVASMPVLASVASAEPDPIFALIEAVNPARAKADEAHDIHERLIDEFFAIPRPVGKVTILGHQFELDRREKLVALLNEATFDGYPAQHEAERTVILSKFDEDQRAYDAKRQPSSLDEAERRTVELCQLRWDAEDAVLNAQPRSHAGIFALLMFVAEYLAEDMDSDMCKIVPVFVNAARAMRATAGDAAPISISKSLQEVLDGERV
jgi:hypothetical protein